MGIARALLVILKVMLFHVTLVLLVKLFSLPAKVSQLLLEGNFSSSKSWTLTLQEKPEKMEFSNPSLCKPPQHSLTKKPT